jgi:beta-lactam-binding protein with PASTA domain
MPATFAAKNGALYPRATLPDNLPLPKAAKMVAVPDFSGCGSWEACNEAAARAGLVAHQQPAAMEPAPAFKVLSASPPPGTFVPEGTTVTIVTQPVKVDPRAYIRPHLSPNLGRLGR